MKKFMLIALLGVGIGQVYAQKINENEVPKAVKDGFAKAYPAVKKVKWEKEDGSFEASFDQNKKEMSAVLDEQGAVKEVETEIAKSELPQVALDILKRDYVGYKIEETAKILANGVTTFEAEVEKGEKTFELIFDSTGKLLKKTEKKEGEEDKD